MLKRPSPERAVARLIPVESTLTVVGQNLLQEVPPAIQINLRGPQHDNRFLREIGIALECHLPLIPNTTERNSCTVVYWLGPDEWLVVHDGGDTEVLLKRIEGCFAEIDHAAATDVTGNRTRFLLSGPHAREVLMKGCTLDLDCRVFRPGQCGQIALARAGVILHQVDDTPSYHIFPRRSFAEYVWMWLRDAMAEYDG